MGVRPPSEGSDDAELIEFGIAALAARIDDADLSFPVRRDELVRELGDPEIPIDANGTSVSLSTVTDEVAAEEFDSEQELLNDLHPVFETYRADTTTGLLSSIRSLFPF